MVFCFCLSVLCVWLMFGDVLVWGLFVGWLVIVFMLGGGWVWG